MTIRKMVQSAALCALLVGCGTLLQQQQQQQGSATPVGTWFNPPSDYPGICMTLSKDGALKFDSGFAFFNPARWTYDAAAQEMRIVLGGTETFPAPLEKDMKKTHPTTPRQGDLLRFDAAKRSFTYRVRQDTDAIDLGGHKFYRNRACVAQK
jgi:hypothetical protein